MNDLDRKADRRSPIAAVGAHLRGRLLAGVLALIPLVVTIYVLRLVFNFVDDLVDPLVRAAFGRDIIGVGVGITIVFVYVLGLVTTNFLGRGLIRGIEAVVKRIPVVNWVYSIAKSVVDAFTQAGKSVSRVAIVEWPQKGTYTIAFLTNTVLDRDGRRFHTLLIPTTPTPQSGLLAIMPEEQVTLTNLTVDEGVKLVVSSGVLSPAHLLRTLQVPPPVKKKDETS